MIWYRRLMGPEACIAAEGAGSDQQSSPAESTQSKGEDKEFGDKWEQINEEKANTTLEGPLEESESSHPPYQHLDPSILHHSPGHHHHHHHILHHLPDEGSQDSQDIHEGSITPPTSTGSAASPCAERSHQPSSFLFVGPLGKKRKYSRQRATSDDNESETHPPTAAGSPEALEEEMDHSQSPSPGESVQSEMDGSNRKNSSVQEQSSSPSPGEFQSSSIITPTSNLQSHSSDSSTESPCEVITSKPSPIIGAPTSVIRRNYRKKQEHPLNLSVSSPPSSSFSSSSTSTVLGGRLLGASGSDSTHGGPTAPSVVRDELYFDGRAAGDRQVFVWRYRDEVGAPSPISAGVGPMSPTTSTVSAASFAVPDPSGPKLGSSAGSSSASSVSQLPPGSHDGMAQDKCGGTSGTASAAGSGKGPKKKLRCGDCGKEFSQLRNYRYHRSRHEGSDQFSCTCPVCGKQFNDRGYLSSHMKIHRNAKEYRCEYCTKGFNQRVAYNMHRRIHTGHRPHQCEVCGKSFSRRMLLKQHMRIHTGERPYSCGVCNKAFADRSNMLLHQRLHSGERPYVCEICKKSFSKNHHLKTHMNHHAGIKPYECPKCHARFSQSSNMKTHLKKCSGVPNPTSTQRQQMLRRNPLDIGRPTAHLPPLQSVVSAAAASGRESLPSLPGSSRLLYDQQSLNLLSQSLGCNQTVPQLSPGHSRGQMPIESLLLHLNVSRSRHPSQSSMHQGQPPSPTSSIPFPDLQLMLRNAVASGSRPVSSQSNSGQRLYSTPSPPCSSSNPSGAGAMIISSGMGCGGIAHSPTSVVSNIRRSPAEGVMGSGNESISPPSLSPMMVLNPTLGLVGYGMSTGSRTSGHGHIDSSVMPPPSTNGTVLRNVPTSSSLISPELLSPVNSMLKIDTRSMEGFPSTLISPSDKGRQGRGMHSPAMSPRKKQPSPSSLSASGSFIPLSTLESAAIASGLRSPSQVARFLTSALRDAEAPLQAHSPGSYSSSRLPPISQQNVLEVMAAAAAAEQNLNSGPSSSSSLSSTRMRQVISPHHSNLQQQQAGQGSHSHFQFSGDNRPLPSLQLSHGSSGSHHHHHHHHSSSPPQHHMSGNAQTPPPFSVITSSHLLQQHQQDQHGSSLNMQHSSLPNVRFSSSSSPSSASRLNTMDEHSQQQLELQQSRQYGYHQNLLLSHISQGTVTSGNYSNPNPSSGYSTFTHSIIRSRSQSPVSQLPRERNQDYPN
ncbi:unnamed protein product [Orchesella dallaii]|uniref:C2H2-type domain-containing protein n=1 Tax=Orchesella dallaii TaxID=48710 RepID=A0ABP1QI48_9HEXA